jgi:hypothetical protein
LLGVCTGTEASCVEVFGAAELISWLGIVPAAGGVAVSVWRLLVIELRAVVETLKESVTHEDLLRQHYAVWCLLLLSSF